MSTLYFLEEACKCFQHLFDSKRKTEIISSFINSMCLSFLFFVFLLSFWSTERVRWWRDTAPWIIQVYVLCHRYFMCIYHDCSTLVYLSSSKMICMVWLMFCPCFPSRWWRKIFPNTCNRPTEDSLLTRWSSLPFAPFSGSPRTDGHSLLPPRTSDGFLINPRGGQRRPDENGVQTSWEDYQACVHSLLRRERETIPKTMKQWSLLVEYSALFS